MNIEKKPILKRVSAKRILLLKKMVVTGIITSFVIPQVYMFFFSINLQHRFSKMTMQFILIGST